MIRKILIISGIFIAVLFIIYFELIIYGLGQGYGQVKVLLNAQSIEEILKSETLPEEMRRKLLLVGDIKKFAVEELGLENSENYTNTNPLPFLKV